MCTNRLECYMNDIADSVEDFVKKSLILLAIAIASVVGLIFYVIKVVTNQPASLLGEEVCEDKNSTLGCVANTATSTAPLQKSKKQDIYRTAQVATSTPAIQSFHKPPSPPAGLKLSSTSKSSLSLQNTSPVRKKSLTGPSSVKTPPTPPKKTAPKPAAKTPSKSLTSKTQPNLNSATKLETSLQKKRMSLS